MPLDHDGHVAVHVRFDLNSNAARSGVARRSSLLMFLPPGLIWFLFLSPGLIWFLIFSTGLIWFLFLSAGLIWFPFLSPGLIWFLFLFPRLNSLHFISPWLISPLFLFHPGLNLAWFLFSQGPNSLLFLEQMLASVLRLTTGLNLHAFGR